jgi:hypothetical protein
VSPPTWQPRGTLPPPDVATTRGTTQCIPPRSSSPPPQHGPGLPVAELAIEDGEAWSHFLVISLPCAGINFTPPSITRQQASRPLTCTVSYGPGPVFRDPLFFWVSLPPPCIVHAGTCTLRSAYTSPKQDHHHHVGHTHILDIGFQIYFGLYLS